MITFRHREDIAPSVLILLSILTLAATLIYMVVVPVPSAAGTAKGRELSRLKLMKEIDAAKGIETQTAQAIKPHLWVGDTETVTAEALAQVTKQASSHAVKLAAFRPQRPLIFQGTTALQFSVQISGPFPAVRAVIASLDAADSKMVLQSIQIATAEGVASAVTATFGLSVFITPGTASSPEKLTGAVHA